MIVVAKSRFINLLLTGLSRQPVTSFASEDRGSSWLSPCLLLSLQSQADGDDYVRVVNEVPSGSGMHDLVDYLDDATPGSTTRSYSKYVLPLLATQGLGRSA